MEIAKLLSGCMQAAFFLMEEVGDTLSHEDM